jgi:hypothetical protein
MKIERGPNRKIDVLLLITSGILDAVLILEITIKDYSLNQSTSSTSEIPEEAFYQRNTSKSSVSSHELVN